jgi:hypothetical protein
MPGRRLNLRGQKVGFWTVVEPVGTDSRGVVWKLRCACGIEREASTYQISKMGPYSGCPRCRYPFMPKARLLLEKVLALYEQGLDTTLIGRRLGFCRQRAHYLLKKARKEVMKPESQ